MAAVLERVTSGHCHDGDDGDAIAPRIIRNNGSPTDVPIAAAGKKNRQSISFLNHGCGGIERNLHVIVAVIGAAKCARELR